jgi:hypothetical protein
MFEMREMMNVYYLIESRGRASQGPGVSLAVSGFGSKFVKKMESGREIGVSK